MDMNLIPCAGSGCPKDPTTCKCHVIEQFATPAQVRMTRCPSDASGEPLHYVPIRRHRLLSEPTTDWGVLV